MASIIKTDNIQKVSDDSNIIKKCGSTITIGSSGASVALASGATQTGFGRTGTVDWCTTAKTSPFTAVSGDGFFVNTSSGAVTVTLPASPSAGDIVSFADYASSFGCNALTICNNSSKINGGAFPVDLGTSGQSVTLVYVDGTRGWKTVQDSTEDVTGQPNFISATGGTITTCGDFKIHTFTGDGCFAVTQGKVAANNKVSYMVIAGGGGGSSKHGGGGGAGGLREGKLSTDPYTASPKAATPCSSLSVSTQTYPITVGGGGTGNGYPGPYSAGTNGSNSIFSTITSTGGGLGGLRTDGFLPGTYSSGFAGGSGGGAGGENSSTSAGSGNSPPVSPPQGNPGGGWTSPYYGGGGGGATASGTTAQGGAGGAGAGTGINPSPGVGEPGPSAPLRYFAGGGGAGNNGACTDNGGLGGGGAGYAYVNTRPGTGNGATNTGGGGGVAADPTSNTGLNNGGSGIVIIRYKFQYDKL